LTTRAAFGAGEWETITTAPILAAMFVSAAERGGSLRESMAASRAYASARGHDAGPLLRDVLASPPALNQVTGAASTEDIERKAPAKLREAIRALERHTGDDEEVNAYKRFVYSVAEAVAHAHREGGFLGIGGSDVSEREQAALDEIAAIFDAPRSASEPIAAPSARSGFTADEARRAGDAIGIDWASARFDVEQFRRGMEVELEHGRRDPRTNVTDDDATVTAKIAWAHLNELADYYSRLESMEAGSAGG
jgi:hypothetical protein